MVVYTPRGAAESLLARLQRWSLQLLIKPVFSPRFSMVTPLGRALDVDALHLLFQAAGGQKKGFRIQLSELRVIALHQRGATVSYREQQSDASGAHTDRRSTVVFEKLESGRVFWLHLQETFCSE